MNTFLGLKIKTHPLLPSELPTITFDPQHKCTWATPEYRASMDAWLLRRFGVKNVAFMFNPRAVGIDMDGGLFINPKHVAVLRDFS